MTETPKTTEMDNISDKLFNLSYDIETLSCRAHFLEDEADELTRAAEEIGQELKRLAEKEETE